MRGGGGGEGTASGGREVLEGWVRLVEGEEGEGRGRGRRRAKGKRSHGWNEIWVLG